MDIKRKLANSIIMAILTCLLCQSAVTASPPKTDADVSEVVVRLKTNVEPSDMTSLCSQLHLSLHHNSPFSEEHTFVAYCPHDALNSVITRLKADPRVEFAEPNFSMEAFSEPYESAVGPQSVKVQPNDPLYKYQWHMQKINVEKAWAASTGTGAIVAVIDTGVAYEDYGSGRFHQVEDLKGTRFVKGYNFLTRNEHANDDHGHGTHVAGTIAQTTHNGIGTVGVAYNASIMPLKVLSSRGFGKTSDIADAIRFAANKGANIINMSLGGPGSSQDLESACKYAFKKGVTIVCAAGNSNSDQVSYPARYPECIAVSATRFDDQLTFYTNRGKRIDIAAPGGDMNVDQNGDGYRDGVLQNTIMLMDPTQETYALYQGTSMASPHVAGAAALLVSLGITNPRAIKQRLQSTARTEGIDDLESGYGAGVLDVGKAVYATAFVDPLTRLALGLLVLGALILLAPHKPRLTPALLAGLVVGTCGLFFLPYIGLRWNALRILTLPLPDWDIPLAGMAFHANALFWSAFVPFCLAVTTFGQTRLQGFALGLSVGIASFLLHNFYNPTAVIAAIPGHLLNETWLLVNAVGCILLAYILSFTEADVRGARPARGQQP